MATTLSACATLGLRTAYIGSFGSDDNAALVREALEARGVELQLSVAREVSNPFAVILLDASRAERVVLWHRDSALALTATDLSVPAIEGCRLLHVDDVDEEASITAGATARQAGVPVTSDIDHVTSRTGALLDVVTIPIFAEHVPEAITGVSDMARALEALRRPHHQFVCATLGSRGALLLDGTSVHHAPAVEVETMDTTGAGDVFRGAFIYALLRGDGPAEILRFANAAAAASCTRIGAIASVPAMDEVRLLLLQEDAGQRRNDQL